MPKTYPRMRLSRDEENFLRHWMYEEVHYRDGPGPAKELQRDHRAVPADVGMVIAAAIPEPAEQAAAGDGPDIARTEGSGAVWALRCFPWRPPG